MQKIPSAPACTAPILPRLSPAQRTWNRGVRSERSTNARQKFHPFVAPLADEAFVLHFTGELKPWRLSASYAEQWTTHGAALTPTGHVAGGCELDQQLSGLMDRRIYYCRKRAPCGDARFARFNSTTSLFASACLARFPLCAAGRGVAACASLWHGYVSPAAARVADL